MGGMLNNQGGGGKKKKDGAKVLKDQFS